MVFQPGQSGSPAHRFPPGVSGNPNGRPKDQSLRAMIRALAAKSEIDGQPVKGGKTVKDLLAEKFIIEALKGKHPFAHDVLEAIDGKLTEHVEHSGIGGGPIALDAAVCGMSNDEINAWRERKRAEVANRPTEPPA